jgi:hypothetical protein
MNFFYVEDLNISVACLNKSGSTLISRSMEDFCFYKDYKIYDISHNSNYYKKKDIKNFIFVRNPIDRLKTSFTWFLRNKSFSTDFFGEYNPENLLNENNFNKFFNNMDNIIKLNDYHFMPQKNQLLNMGVNTYQITKKLIDFVYVDGLIIKIEDFDESIKNLDNSNNKMLSLFNDEDFKLFSIFYTLNKKRLNILHNSNIKFNISKILELEISNYFNDEIVTYGY